MRVTSKQNIERIKVLINSGYLPDLDTSDLFISVTPHEVGLGNYTVTAHQNGIHIQLEEVLGSDEVVDLKLRGVVIGLMTSREVINYNLIGTINMVIAESGVAGTPEYLDSDARVITDGITLTITNITGNSVTLNLESGDLKLSSVESELSMADYSQFMTGMLYSANMI